MFVILCTDLIIQNRLRSRYAAPVLRTVIHVMLDSEFGLFYKLQDDVQTLWS